MKKTANPFLNIRSLVLGFALAGVLGIGMFTATIRTSAPRLQPATISSPRLLADDGQETHGGKGKGGRKIQHNV